MNEKQAMIIAFLLSDGSVYYDKSKKTYCLQLTNKIDGLLERFIQLMDECFGLKNYHINRSRNISSVRFFSKKVALELFQYSPTFRTLVFPNGCFPDCRIPQEILEDEKLAAAFLTVFASCDGGIVVNKTEGQYRIELACRHPQLKKQLVAVLARAGFQASECPERVIVRGKRNAKLFIERVGFLPESLVCKPSPHLGISKNDVLGRVLITPSRTTHLLRSPPVVGG